MLTKFYAKVINTSDTLLDDFIQYLLQGDPKDSFSSFSFLLNFSSLEIIFSLIL